jgi:hypothetical protein
MADVNVKHTQPRYREAEEEGQSPRRGVDACVRRCEESASQRLREG